MYAMTSSFDMPIMWGQLYKWFSATLAPIEHYQFNRSLLVIPVMQLNIRWYVQMQKKKLYAYFPHSYTGIKKFYNIIGMIERYNTEPFTWHQVLMALTDAISSKA